MNSLNTRERIYSPNPPKFWSKRDEAVNSFFVYVLRLESGELYVGHTRELRERLLEHRDGITISTAGKHPKLQYFEILPTRELAMLREHDVKKIVKSKPP